MTNIPKVDFYLLENPHFDAVATTLCKICEKAYDQQKTVFILTRSPQNAEYLNRLLWTYNDTSFIPHTIHEKNEPNGNRENGKEDHKIAVLISFSDSPPPKPYDILLNLTLKTPHFFNQFGRVIEVVSGDTAERTAARERYRFYRDNQCELQSHQLQK